MSYNCDTFKVKKLENLRIPVKSLYKNERSDWHPERKDNDNGTVTFSIMESEINGIIKKGIKDCNIFNQNMKTHDPRNDILVVLSICCRGEGSGTTMNKIIEPALRDSKGELIVSCVWEGGDSINQLIVKNGNINWKDIDI